MNAEKRTNIKVGITVIFSFIILVWIIGWAKNFSFSDNSLKIKVAFNSVAGLSVGDPVSVNGVKKGFVENIYLSGNKAITELNLDQSTEVYSDAKFSVMMLDLMSGKKIEINPGESNILIKNGETYEGKFLGDISSAMASLSSVESDVVTLIHEVKIAITRLNESLLSPEFISSLNNSLTDLNRLTRNANNILKDNEEGINRLVIGSNKLIDNSNELIDSNKTQIGIAVKNINNLLEQSNILSDNINSLLNETKKSENNLGKFLYDENVINNLKETVDSTNELIKLLLKQLKDEGINVDANIF